MQVVYVQWAIWAKMTLAQNWTSLLVKIGEKKPRQIPSVTVSFSKGKSEENSYAMNPKSQKKLNETCWNWRLLTVSDGVSSLQFWPIKTSNVHLTTCAKLTMWEISSAQKPVRKVYFCKTPYTDFKLPREWQWYCHQRELYFVAKDWRL